MAAYLLSREARQGVMNLAAFGDRVRALRGAESRRSTVNDTPILLGVQCPLDEIVRLLGTP
jgi:chlorite dismutase